MPTLPKVCESEKSDVMKNTLMQERWDHYSSFVYIVKTLCHICLQFYPHSQVHLDLKPHTDSYFVLSRYRLRELKNKVR